MNIAPIYEGTFIPQVPQVRRELSKFQPENAQKTSAAKGSLTAEGVLAQFIDSEKHIAPSSETLRKMAIHG